MPHIARFKLISPVFFIYVKWQTLFATAVLCLCVSAAFAQFTVNGLVADSSGTLPGASVWLITGTDTLRTATDDEGRFRFSRVPAPLFTLQARMIGYTTHSASYRIPEGKKLFSPGKIILKPALNTLDEVLVKAVIPIRVKQDTLEYDAKAYPVQPDDAVEEVVKKLPGVKVDDKGNVSFQGKPITKVRVNGKDFFGTDVANAIQNLPADIIQNLQIIDDYGEKARLTKVKTGEPEKILNINLQPDKKRGHFTQATAGMGTEERYIGRLRTNNFSGERQLSVSGMLNNTNFRGGRADGLTSTNYIAGNYRNEFHKTLTVYGDYNFNNNVTNTANSNIRQTLFPDFTQLNRENYTGVNRQVNHQLNANLEYKPDTLNFLKVSSFSGYGRGRLSSSGALLSETPDALLNTTIQSASQNTSPSTNGLVFFNHRFKKYRRNLSVNAHLRFSDANDERNLQNTYINTILGGENSTQLQNQFVGTGNAQNNAGINLSYSEPIGKYAFAELSYDGDFTRTKNTRDISDRGPDGALIFNPALSNQYEFRFSRHNPVLNYQFEKDKVNFRLGVKGQHTQLDGDDLSRNNHTRQNTSNWIPTAHFEYKFSNSQAIKANYDAWVNQPNFYQLQPVTDQLNIKNVTTGNPDLLPELSRQVYMEYKQFKAVSGRFLFAQIGYRTTANKIISTRLAIPDSVKQINSFTNTDGYYAINGSYSYTKSYLERKLTLTYEGGADYSNDIALIDAAKNTARNLMIRQGLKLRTDFRDVMDTEFSTQYMHNRTGYSLESYSDRTADRFIWGINGRNFYEKWILGYDFTKTLNRGYNNSNNPLIVNMYLERKLLKRDILRIRLQCFDVFNQNIGISRDVFDNVILDSQINRLARYFLLTMNMRFRKFGG